MTVDEIKNIIIGETCSNCHHISVNRQKCYKSKDEKINPNARCDQWMEISDKILRQDEIDEVLTIIGNKDNMLNEYKEFVDGQDLQKL
jgi:hypothetical protein